MSAPGIDLAALNAYLAPRLNGFAALSAQRFSGGASNPTFLLQSAERSCVLRARPLGAAANAHAIDREYAILSKLAGAALPSPRPLLLCDDEAVIGAMFYIMDYVPGRVFDDRLMRASNPAERRAVYTSLAATLAQLHSIDPADVGLETLARNGDFAARQVKRWRTQYEAASAHPAPAMLELGAWLQAHLPPPTPPRLVHGDFRLGNVIVHETEPRVVALLDWELATLGDPMADLAYCCMSYHLPAESGRGFLPLADEALDAYGIPREADFVAAYCGHAGRAAADHWPFWMAFSMFRGAAILTGVQQRATDANAAAQARAAAQDMIAAGWRSANS